MRCSEYAWRNLRWAVEHFAGALLTGTIFALFAGWFVYEAVPSRLDLVNLRVASRAGGAAFWIELHYRWSDAALRCGRLTIERIYPLTADGYDMRRPIRLGIAMDGPQFPDNVQDVWATEIIPLGTPSGTYGFIADAAFSCPPFRLIPWAASTGIVRIDIPRPFSQAPE